ncbi:MAG: MerR family transcriptional regulator [Chloroflexota bacterium]
MFRIGEFCKVAQVSGRLLRYYDQIGLFSPEYIDPSTGYRFYRAQQLPQLNRILVMKELGLSLEQIKQLLARDITTDEIRGMLLLKKAQVEQTVQDELARLHYLESRLKELDNNQSAKGPDVILKAIPTQRYLSMRAIFPDLKAVHQCVGTIYRAAQMQIDKKYLSYIMFVVHSAAFDAHALDFEIGHLVDKAVKDEVKLPDAHILILSELPQVELMATVIHAGDPQDIHLSYRALAMWIEDNHYRLVGSGREVFIELPIENHEAVAEIQIPVVKKTSSVN